MTEQTGKRTPLYDEHVQLGARMIEFGGWLMPVEYTGIIEEHRTVRRAAGLFDLSHMGELRVRGAGAITFVDQVMTNDIAGLEIGQARYTPICRPDGGIVDDVIVYRLPDSLLIVVNAANIQKDRMWLEGMRDEWAAYEPSDAEIIDESADTALIALQGPAATQIMAGLCDPQVTDLAPFTARQARVAGVEALVSRTGYTGEDGFELYLAATDAPGLWQQLLTAGESRGVVPVGLGARDTLRLEARLPLYGQDLTENTSPLEAGLAWTVKFDKGDFVGRDALLRQKEQGLERRLVGFRMLERGIPRHDYPLHAPAAGGDPGAGTPRIGTVTSGTMSPSLGEPIGVGYVDKAYARPGSHISVDVRGKLRAAEIVKGRFVTARTSERDG